MQKVLTIAHRGFSAIAPENTLAAFKRALELKPDLIECDVRRTKDGKIVIIHDATVDRTTNGTGRVADMTLEELRRLDAGSWFGTQYAGERLPTLEEFLDLPWGETQPIIEIKEQSLEDDVVALVQQRGMSARTAICSFHHKIGLRLKELDRLIRFSPLISSQTEISGDEAVRLADEAAAVNGWVFGVNYTAITPDLVKATHAANMLMEAWTVDDEENIRRMVTMGVDVIASNRLDLLLQVLAEMGVRNK
ncbi:MAG: glycerophosphodiester phosphodiesterase family protein [Armatimonadota bacterium]|nr:glycerophosphodiester phosphodiesterase family protein [Armatimonadota bacterium]